MLHHPLRLSILLFCTAATLVLAGCTDDATPWYSYTPAEDSPARVAYDTGMNKYLNTATPSSVEDYYDSTVYTYDPDDGGPVCMRGAPFRTSIRKTDSNNLLIFLQGGGACWDDYCLAVIHAQKGIPSNSNILDPKLDLNPTRDWNVVYVPYCDGSLFVGDRTKTDDKGPRIYAGLKNLSAALTVAREQFPHPDKILYAGSSAGGFGVVLTTPLVRYIWPNTPLYVMDDSGVGVAHDGDPAFVKMLMTTFGAEDLVPDDCQHCTDDGNITGFIEYYLKRDKKVKVGVFSSWFDSTISRSFLQVDPITWGHAVQRITDELHQEFPDRYKRFFVNGKEHTALLGNPSGIVGANPLQDLELPDNFNVGDMISGGLSLGRMDKEEIDGTILGEWLGYMLNDSTKWVDLTETPNASAVSGIHAGGSDDNN